MEIRELKPSDAAPYRALRIQALREWPPAFGAPAEEEEVKPLSETESFLIGSKNQKLFGAFVDGVLIGTVRCSRYSGSNESYRFYLAGFYVKPNHRSQGIGRALLTASIEEAKKDPIVRRINLTVVSAQSEAIQLYESMGFSRCGVDYEAFSARGQFFDELLMTKPIVE